MVPALIEVPARFEPAGGVTGKISGEVIGMSGTIAVPAAPVESAQP
jgi:hypothetical protein